MNTDTHRFKHKELTGKVIGVFYDVYNELGHGFRIGLSEIPAARANICRD
jgi:hypothetical protein